MIEVTLDEFIRDTTTKVALAKDRIFYSYLAERGLMNDYEEWVGVLNNDPERMQKLVFGE